MKRKETKRLAVASLLCALTTVISLVGCVLDVADLTAVTAASAVVALSGTELGKKYQILIYAVCSALLLLLFPSATVSLYFVLYFGYYPIIREYFARLPRLFSWILKYMLFNTAIISVYFLMTKILLSAEAEESMAMLLTLWLMANAFFAVYDIAIGVFTLAYTRVYRKKWGIDKFMLG